MPTRKRFTTKAPEQTPEAPEPIKAPRPVTDLAYETDHRVDGLVNLAQGWTLLCEFSNTGGTQIRSEVGEDGHETTILKTVKVDNPSLAKDAEALRQKAYNVMREYCTEMFRGLFFCPFSDLPEVEQHLAELRNRADKLNAFAEEIGSDREVRIELTTLVMPVTSARDALRLGKAVHEKLTRLKNGIVADYGLWIKALEGAANLPQMLVGHQRDVVDAAIKDAEQQYRISRYHEGSTRGYKELEAEYGGRVPPVNFSKIDAAIALFEPATRLRAFTSLDSVK